MRWCSDRNSSSAVTPPPAAPENPTTTCTVVTKKADVAAARLISGVTAAFFSSLQRFACLNINTKGDSDEARGFEPIASSPIPSSRPAAAPVFLSSWDCFPNCCLRVRQRSDFCRSADAGDPKCGLLSHASVIRFRLDEFLPVPALPPEVLFKTSPNGPPIEFPHETGNQFDVFCISSPIPAWVGCNEKATFKKAHLPIASEMVSGWIGRALLRVFELVLHSAKAVGRPATGYHWRRRGGRSDRNRLGGGDSRSSTASLAFHRLS
nr:hypothetical protein BC332_05634 [Ipomoea trifida]